jgi:hypothetical protein
MSQFILDRFQVCHNCRKLLEIFLCGDHSFYSLCPGCHEAIRLFLCIVVYFIFVILLVSVLSWFWLFCSILCKLEVDDSILPATLQTGFIIFFSFP